MKNQLLFIVLLLVPFLISYDLHASIIDCPGDINGDSVVDGGDLGILLSEWGSCNSCASDLDQDAQVAGSDLGLLLSLWDVTGASCPSPSSSRFTKRPTGTLYEDQGFWEYLPQGYESKEEWPLIIFYHGLGENGNGSSGELNLILGNGIPKLINNDQWPVESSSVGDEFIVLSPQHSGNGCHDAFQMDEFLRWATENYAVDPTRIYMTGLSCGGIGVWNYLLFKLDDDLVAAAIPICGDGQLAYFFQGCNIGKVPIWGFHGDADDVVSPQGTIGPIQGLQSCTNPVASDARLTVYPGVGHDSWTRTYNLSGGNDIYEWLLSQSNP